MELQRLLIWVCFAFCLGLTAGGVLIFFRLKDRSGLPVIRYFQYYLVMMYAYAYYALWSDVFVQLFLPQEEESELTEKISGLLLVVSTPFLLIGLIMLVAWLLRIIEKKSRFILIIGMTISVVVSAAVVWWVFPLYLDRDPHEILSFFLLTVAIFASVQLYLSPLKFLNRKYAVMLASLMLGFAGLQFLIISGLQENTYVLLGYLLLFFLVNSAMGALLVYTGEFPDPAGKNNENLSFPSFIEKFGITPREEEIIAEIYKGKTNREIAETLFVTVQTIKDHTHRIYQKTGVRNRNQLSSLLRDFEMTK